MFSLFLLGPGASLLVSVLANFQQPETLHFTPSPPAAAENRLCGKNMSDSAAVQVPTNPALFSVTVHEHYHK